MTSFLVSRSPLAHVPPGTVGLSSENLILGGREFTTYFGGIDPLEEDLLLLAAGIFAVDRAVARQERESFHRTLDVSFALAFPERFVGGASQLERILHLLTHDSWRVTFEADPLTSRERVEAPPSTEGATLLFSGGLDSFAAALERLDRMPLQLVSHRTHNTRTQAAQNHLAEGLRGLGFAGAHRTFFVSSKDAGRLVSHAVETSQRTRSFLFLVLGALSAFREGHGELVWIAENGLLAIHLPISTARIGAFSTHTAHPEVIAAVEAFIGEVVGQPLRITNPFLYRTKGEVTRVALDRSGDLVFQSESCWKSARLPQETSHCGECIPCLHRHIAIAQHTNDQTGYQRRIWEEHIGSLPFEDDGRRNVAELAEFIVAMRDYDNEEAIATWVELINPHFDLSEALDLHRRFGLEALSVLSRYDSLAQLLV